MAEQKNGFYEGGGQQNSIYNPAPYNTGLSPYPQGAGNLPNNRQREDLYLILERIEAKLDLLLSDHQS